MLINGFTRLFAILGDPITQVKTPELMNACFIERGDDAVLVPMQVKADHLHDSLAALDSVVNLAGLVFTMPHKVDALEWVDDASQRAKSIGAINVAVRRQDGGWYGDNLDGEACLLAMRQACFKPQSAKVLLIGGGGAGQAIGYTLLANGVASLVLAEANIAKAQKLLERWQIDFPETHISLLKGGQKPEFNALINASPEGSYDNSALPCSESLLANKPLVMDIILTPSQWLEKAKQRHCVTCSGKEMILAQAEPMYMFFSQLDITS